MKVLSDKTARRLIEHLDASGRSSRATPRGAATTPPPPLWQIHIDPFSGAVSIGKGLCLVDGKTLKFNGAAVGEASGDEYVCLTFADPTTPQPELIADTDEMDRPYVILGKVGTVETTYGTQYCCEQFIDFCFSISTDAHWGGVEPLVELPADGAGTWNANKDENEATAAAKSYLVDIDVDDDGKVTGKHYRTDTIDTNGNVVAVSERTEDAAPDPGEADEDDDEPNCGHPLNESDDDHPLGNGDDYEEEPGGGGGIDDEHPLDNDGDGGYSPACAENKEN